MSDCLFGLKFDTIQVLYNWVCHIFRLRLFQVQFNGQLLLYGWLVNNWIKSTTIWVDFSLYIYAKVLVWILDVRVLIKLDLFPMRVVFCSVQTYFTSIGYLVIDVGIYIILWQKDKIFFYDTVNVVFCNLGFAYEIRK